VTVKPPIVIVALLHDARIEPRLEGLIRDHAKVRQRLHLSEPDKNGEPRPRVSVYIVEARDGRLLRSSLRALQKARNQSLELIIR